MKNKKKIIGIIVTVLIVLIICITVFIFMQKKNEENKPQELLKEYFSLLSNQEYSKMYNLLTENSKKAISEEDFITRNKNIYEGIDATNINVEFIQKEEKDNNVVQVVYNTNLDTAGGTVNFKNTMPVKKENKEFKIEWTSNLIFPNLNSTDKVRISNVEAERGKILDRNDVVLAGKGSAQSVGLVPGKMSENKEEDIKKVADLLQIDTDTITKQLSASYVKDDTFVPLKTIEDNDVSLENSLLEIPGIKITRTFKREYPYKEATSHLVGYIQSITSEELENNQGKGYTQNSLIGKSGLEKIYEDKLKGTNGTEIYITDSEGNKKETIIKQDVKNGEDIKLTIDVNLQQKAYEQFKEDKSATVIMNPKTGEILALVSTPTFDSNDFIKGMSNEKWKQLNEDGNNPLYNRFKACYAPGSTFKPVIAGIGLTNNKFDKDENFGYVGLSWQKDSSWGDYKVTTMTNYGDTVNLRNALVYSDNIYFARAALKIGTDTIEKELNKIGFNQDVPFEIGLEKSSFAENGKIASEIQLADTGYGQAKVLVNPVLMASIYSSFVNEGNMIKPYLEYKENTDNVQYFVKEAFSKEASEEIKEDLVEAVEIGTAKGAKINGVKLAGKTGTAEIKNSKDDTEGTELGWFNAFIADEESDKQLLVVSMVEDVKDRGGSHYLLSKVKTFFE